VAVDFLIDDILVTASWEQQSSLHAKPFWIHFASERRWHYKPEQFFEMAQRAILIKGRDC
jgi:hypothetical protein